MKRQGFRTLALLLLVTMTNLLVAQGPPRNLDLINELGLTQEQVDQVESLRKTMRQEMQSVRQADPSPENRERVREIRNDFENKLTAILDDQQLTKWHEIHAKQVDRADRIGRNSRKGNRDTSRLTKMRELREEINSYRKVNIEPVLQAKRAELNTHISDEDQQTLEELAAKVAAFRAEERDSRTGRGPRGGFAMVGHPGHMGRAGGALSTEDRDVLGGLIDKYRTHIERVLSELDEEQEKWRHDMEQIRQAIVSDNAHTRREAFRHANLSEDKQERIHKRKLGGFLLIPTSMDPEYRLDRAVSVYPNPGSSQQQIKFEVLQTGHVSVEIVDANGNILRKVFEGYMEEGTRELTVTTSDLRGNNFFYRIRDGRGVSLTTAIIH